MPPPLAPSQVLLELLLDSHPGLLSPPPSYLLASVSCTPICLRSPHVFFLCPTRCPGSDPTGWSPRLCCTLATGLGQRSKGGPSSSEQERLPWYLFPSPALQPEVWASLPKTDDQKRACCWFLKCLVRSSSFLVHIVFWNYLMCNVWITDWTYTYGETASEAHGVDISTVCK